MVTKDCAIVVAMTYIGKKWSLHIVRDMFRGKTRFKDFLSSNSELSTKVLSERLKDLEENGIVSRKIIDSHPVGVEYTLTKKGRALGTILYEMAVFSVEQCSSHCVCEKSGSSKDVLVESRKMFKEGAYLKK